MIELSHLSKSYRGTPALKDVSLTLPRGEIVGLFGENGAGKTTLMKSILGLIPHYGTVTLDGAPITRANIGKLSFATSEHSHFPALTAEGHRDFFATHFEAFSHRRFDSLMDFFELPRHRALRGFSTGQKNQFEVILALAQGADYILMDEPFSGNDLFNRSDFYRVLAGILTPSETVLLSTHLIEEVENFVGRAIFLHKGEIIGDITLDELEAQSITLTDYVKDTYHYDSRRVAHAIRSMSEEV